jgi:hypothetical protein
MMTEDGRHIVMLGSGLAEVLQLDDAGICRNLGIEVEFLRHRKMTVVADVAGLKKLRDDCESRAYSTGWDQPTWYYSSAAAAFKKLDAYIKEITA